MSIGEQRLTPRDLLELQRVLNESFVDETHFGDERTEFRKGPLHLHPIAKIGLPGIIIESWDVEHWAEHRGSTRVVIVGVDVIKPW